VAVIAAAVLMQISKNLGFNGLGIGIERMIIYPTPFVDDQRRWIPDGGPLIMDA